MAGMIASADRPAPTGAGSLLVDPSGRRMRKLRLSLTARCGLRCAYCAQGSANAVREPELPPGELARLCRILVGMGIEEIRLTGGEPLDRAGLQEVLDALSPLGAALSLTTNGQDLEGWARPLSLAGVARINVSVDSLRPDVFSRITGGGSLARTLAGIEAARAEGIEVKVNCVVLAGINDGELRAFHDFAARTGLEVRFLELLPAGPGVALHPRLFVPAALVVDRLSRMAGPLEPLGAAPDSTAFRARSAAGAVVGFVAGQSRPFCAGCSRLRLSAAGVLHPCLFREEGIPLAGLQPGAVAAALPRLLSLKPVGRIPSIDRALGALGG